MFDIIGESEIVYEGRTIGHLVKGLPVTFMDEVCLHLECTDDVVPKEEFDELANQYDEALEQRNAQAERIEELERSLLKFEAGIVALHKKLQALSK